MKTLDDLGLCKKSHKIVEDWLQGWLDLFIKQANNKEAWVYRANFEENDFFYFTNCKDILEKDPEAKGQENNLTIRSRKRKILLQLFVKTILGQEVINSTIKCGHCGFSPCWIESLGDGTGHWTFCPKCRKLEVQVFPDGFDTCIDKIKLVIAKRRNEEEKISCPGCKKTRHMLINPKCKNLIKEIQAYKYEHKTTPAFTNFEAALDEVKKIVKSDPRLKDVVTKKRKVPKRAWSTIIKGDKE